MAEEFPPIDNHTTQPASGVFVGRHAEFTEFESLVASRASLITICGAPGVGKTRFIREFIARQGELSAPKRAEFIDLSATPRLAEPDPHHPRLARALADPEPLFVLLDTFEHLVEQASAHISAWQKAAPQHTLIVTSREPLHLAAEHIFQLPPLALDDAAELFIRRAHQGPDSHPDADDAPISPEIYRLVTRLDCLPLAIELAAERARTLPLAELSTQLASSFALLKTRRRDVHGRHASLHAALEGSWRLLSDAEKTVLAHAAIFCDGFTLRAANALIQPEPDSARRPIPIPDTLDTLVDKSLLRIDPGARYAHFGCIRQYAASRFFGPNADLGQNGAHAEPTHAVLEQAKRRHAAFYLDQGEAHLKLADGPRAAECTDWLAREVGNLSAIFRRARRWQAHEIRLRAARLLDEHYRRTGNADAHAQILDQALEEATTAADPLWQARFLRRRARLHAQSGHLERAQNAYERALALSDAHQNAELVAWTRFEYGELCRQRGDIDRGLAELEAAEKSAHTLGLRALERAAIAHQACCDVDRVDYTRARHRIHRLHAIEQTDDLCTEAHLYRRLAYVHYYLGELIEQRHLNQRALKLAEALGDRRLFAVCAQGLADSYFADAQFDKAIELYRDALRIHRELGDEHLEGILLGNLAAALHRQEELDAAEDAYRRSLRIHRSSRARPYLAVATSALGVLEHERSRLPQARAHYEQAGDYFDQLGHDPDRASVLLYLGWLALEMDDPTAAEAHFLEAHKLFGHRQEVASWAAVALASLAVLRATQADRDGCAELLERACQAVRTRPDSLEENLVKGLAVLAEKLFSPHSTASTDAHADTCWPGDKNARRRSLHARLVERLLRRLPDSHFAGLDLGETSAAEFIASPTSNIAHPAPATPALTVLADGSGFEVPGHPRADLRRRRALRLILAEFTRRARAETPQSLAVYDAFDIGWPGEIVAPDIAAGRVYWAVRTLRELGLGEMLITTDDGYMLAPQGPIKVLEAFPNMTLDTGENS